MRTKIQQNTPGLKRKKVIIAYILSELGGGLGGLFLTAYFGSARADMGSETILPIITAVVVGGTLITGGKGSIIGTVLASIFIGLIRYGLQMTGLTNEQSNVVIGIILILSVIMRHFKLHRIPDTGKRICIRRKCHEEKLGIVFIVCMCLIGLIACSSQTADRKKRMM